MCELLHNFSKDNKETTDCVFLLVLCTSVHSPWASLIPFPSPVRTAFSHKPQTQPSMVFLPAWSPRFKEGNYQNGAELAFNLTQQLQWKASDVSSSFICVVWLVHFFLPLMI